MEEDVRSSERESGVQTESLSLKMRETESGEEEEATLPYDEEHITNGHMKAEDRSSPVTDMHTQGTNDWSVLESPESPFFLSPAPGPSRQRVSPGKSELASRTGHSRIPGRDHRRYYHEHWRTEYLMDFDAKRNGMICMVCGSSLATLKLSTIKRHISQKHPDSLLWSASDKEVIRSGWESHLNLETTQKPCLDLDPLFNMEVNDNLEENSTVFPPPPDNPDVMTIKSESNVSTAPDLTAQESSTLPNEMLERYVNDSLHAWLRQEFLMEYQAEAGRLVCMVCSCPLPSLHLDHIKSHVLEQHPTSLVYSAEEKHRILRSWAQIQESGATSGCVELKPITKDLTDSTVQCPPFGGDLLQQDAELQKVIKAEPRTNPEPSPKTKLRTSCPWHLRLDYLVAIGPPGKTGCFCMVCSVQLPVAKVSCFRRHIQNCHPEATNYSQQQREDIASAWWQGGAKRMPEALSNQDTIVAEPVSVDAQTSPVKPLLPSGIKNEDGEALKNMTALNNPGRPSHYPGKDQRRNYQLRWRLEYLMDYDCRRHGLICMVCGATLATLKVSTIKRHIQQVHPHSLAYSEEAKQQAVQSYNKTVLNFIHSDDCFSTPDNCHVVQITADPEVNQAVPDST